MAQFPCLGLSWPLTNTNTCIFASGNGTESNRSNIPQLLLNCLLGPNKYTADSEKFRSSDTLSPKPPGWAGLSTFFSILNFDGWSRVVFFHSEVLSLWRKTKTGLVKFSPDGRVQHRVAPHSTGWEVNSGNCKYDGTSWSSCLCSCESQILAVFGTIEASPSFCSLNCSSQNKSFSDGSWLVSIASHSLRLHWRPWQSQPSRRRT